MNNFKKALFLVLSFAGQSAFAKSYSEQGTAQLIAALNAHDLLAAQDALENKKADLYGKNSKGLSAFFLAIIQGLPFVKLLITHGVDINARERLTESQLTPLMAAAGFGKDDVVQLLLTKKPQLDEAALDSGNTALMLASERGHWPCVYMLLEAGANPFHQNIAGNIAHALANQSGKDTWARIQRAILDACENTSSFTRTRWRIEARWRNNLRQPSCIENEALYNSFSNF